ncbi:MAG: MATE family efflux transporter [Christensenellaceae bacterium]|nr:MATE family efflux transporter [Christensenellaceae bacterium]
MKDHARRMTEGPIWKHILFFALPIFWGSLFQQMYNVVDSLVVGNALGSEALASVGSSGSLIFLMTGLFQGTFMGAGVVVSRYWGAQDDEGVSMAVHTAVAFALLSGLTLTVLGIIFAPVILRWMGTPEEVMPLSQTYLRFYFSGVLATVMYNSTNGIFNAVGDSRHPLYYLIISSLTNVALDLLFVCVFGFGVAGAAVATVISQAVSASLGLFRLTRSRECFRLIPSKIRLHWDMLRQILRMGIPSGLQNSIISLANLVVQSHINAFGALAMAGCGAYAKIEGFGFLPITSFSMAMTTFVGQNLGAGEQRRARQGARFGVLACLLLAELIGIGINLLAPVFIRAFDTNPEVIAFGVMQARTVTLFYFLLAFSHGISGVLRGAGRAIVPMIVMLVCWCVIRVSYIVLVTPLAGTIRAVFWAYPLTWCLSSICFAVYYFKADWTRAIRA